MSKSWKDYYTEITGQEAPSVSAHPKENTERPAPKAATPTATQKPVYNPLDDIMRIYEPKTPTVQTKQNITSNALFDAWRGSVGKLENDRKEREAKAKAEAEQKEYKQLQSQLERIDANRAYVTTTEQNDALEKERASVVKRMGEIGSAPATTGEKIKNAFQGSGSRTTEGFTREQETQYQELLSRLDGINSSAVFAFTTEQSDALEKERRETLNALHQMDADAGREARAYDARDRADAFFGGWGKGTAASYTNAAASGADVLATTADKLADASSEKDRRVMDNPYAGWATDELSAANFAAAPVTEETSGLARKRRADIDAAYETADKLLTESEQQMAKAKYGTSAVGSFALDAAKTGMDILADTAASAVGVPGLANMAARVYGGESQQARLAGDDVYTAAAKGLKSALIEVATEKVAGPFEKAYGKTALSSSINKAVDKLNASGLLKWAADAAGEGFEEGMSDVLNTVADHIFGWDSGENSVLGDIAADKDEIVYDMLLGAFVGAFGGAGNLARERANTQTTTAPAAPVQTETARPTADAALAEYSQPTTSETASASAGTLSGASQSVGGISALPTMQNVKQGDSGALNSPLNLNSRETQATAPAEAQKNTAPTQETEKSGDKAVVQKLKEATPQLSQMGTVSTVSGAEIGRNGKVVERLMNFVERIGGKVTRPGFGDVVLTRSKIKASMIGHGVGDAKIDTFAAVPDVIANGIEIDHQSNWKGRNYDTYLFAAPVEYKGEKTYVGVVVQKDSASNRYYLHEVVDGSGNIIYKNAAAASTPDGTSALAGDLETVVDTETANAGTNDISSDTSIPTSGQNVNGNFAGNAERERGVSKNVRTDTAMEQELRDSFEQSPEMYTQLSNKDTLAKAKEIYAKGYEYARSEVERAIGKGKEGYKIAPEIVPLAKMVSNELTRRGEVETARGIMADIALEATAAGQFNQAQRIMRNSDPVTALMSIEKLVEEVNTEFQKNNPKSKWKAELTETEKQKILATDFTEDGVYKQIYDEIATRLGKEMPSSAFEKITEIRRINMLLRPRTQIKNIVSNVPMVGLRKGAETLSIGIQSALTKTGLMEEADRTRAWASKEQRQMARDYYDANKADINGQSNKWDLKTVLREKRTIFKGGAIEKAVSKMTGKEIDSFGEALRQVTYNCLEAGDAPFVKSAFVDSLAQYCAAKGITSSENITREAIDFATANAMEATFKNANVIADLVNRAKRNSSPAVSAAIDILIPFTTTPANILSLMGDYSPVGFGKVFAKGGPAEKIDAFSKASVGTAMLALGYALRNAGVITGGEDDDKDKAALDKATGQGTYSIGGKVSYDWAQPVGSLLAFGAEIADAVRGQESWDSAVMNAIYTAGDATLNLSLFQNIISVLRGSGKPTQQIIDAIMEGGATQLVPGVAGDIAKLIDGTVRSTYTGGNVFDDIGAKTLSTTPVLSKKLPESVNVKGETNTRGELVERAVNTLLNPTNITRGKRNAVDEEIYRLYDTTGSTVFFPSVSPYKIEYDNQTYTMNGKDRETFQKTQGQTYYELAQPLLGSEMYKALNDDQKAAVLKSIRDYALDAAKRQFVDGRGGEYSNTQWDPVAELSKKQISTYIPAKQALKDGANSKGGKKTYDAIDLLLDGYKKLPDAVQDRLMEENLNIANLLYADSKGIGSKAWYDTHNAIDGTGAVAAASAVSRNFKGGDKEKLDALRTMNSYTAPNKETGKQSAIVRRYEAAMNYGVSFDDWTRLEETIVDMFGSGTPNKSEIYAAAKEALPNVPQYKVYNLYKKDSANEKKVDIYDMYFADLYEPTGGKPESESDGIMYKTLLDMVGLSTGKK